MPTITETLMGAGTHTTLLRHHDPAVCDEAARFHHLLYWWGETCVAAGPILLTPRPPRLTIAGPMLEWHLGRDDLGPTIDHRLLTSGRNKLSNPGFELEALDWHPAEDTVWTITDSGAGSPRSGSWWAETTANPGRHDILTSDDVFTVRAGETYRLVCWAHRVGAATTGRLRARIIGTGRYTAPNLEPDPGFELAAWTISHANGIQVIDPPNARNGSNVLQLGRTPDINQLDNPGLEDGATAWTFSHGNVTAHNDALEARTGDQTIRVLSNPLTELLTNPGFEDGLTGWTRSDTGQITHVTDNTESRSGDDVVRIAANKRDNLIQNPGFEDGTTGWNGPTTDGRMEIVTDATNARTGDDVLRIRDFPRANLINEGGFETAPADAETEVADGWLINHPVAGAGDNWSRNTTTRRSGSASAAFQAPIDASTPFSSIESDFFTVEGGKTYCFKMYVLGETTRDAGHAWVTLDFGGTAPTTPAQFCSDNAPATLNDFGHLADFDPRSGDWELIQATFTAPDGADEARVRIWVEGNDGGQLYFDDVEVVAHDTEVQAVLSNLIDLEPGAEYLASTWIRRDADAVDGVLVVQVILPDPSAGDADEVTESRGITRTDRLESGGQQVLENKWLQVPVSFRASADYDQCRVGVTARNVARGHWWVDDWHLALREGTPLTITSDAQTVDPGRPYTASAWLRSDDETAGRATLIVRLTNPTTTEVELHESPALKKTGDDWQQLAVQVTPGEGFTEAAVQVRVENHFFGYWWLDDASLHLTEGTPLTATADTVTVEPAIAYVVAGWLRSDDAQDAGRARLTAILRNPSTGEEEIKSSDPLRNTSDAWQQLALEVTPSEGFTELDVRLTVENHFVGAWWADDLTVHKLEGEPLTATSSAPVTVEAERPYEASVWVRSDADDTHGRFQLHILLTNTETGETETVRSTTLEPTGDVWKLLTVSYTPPSGFNEATLILRLENNKSGDWWADDVRHATTALDTKTLAELIYAGTSSDYTQQQADLTVPDGTERIHLELVAEVGAEGWLVDDLELTNTAAAQTVAAIVTDLLKSPTTDQHILQPGTILGDDNLQYDVRLLNTHLRDAIRHLSRRGPCSPFREWRCRPDGTFDWGTPEEIFTDRTNLVFQRGDLLLLDDPDLQNDNEDVCTQVRVIGREARTTRNTISLIEGTATNSLGSDAVDYFGNPIERTQVIQDASIDHRDYAGAWARYVADQHVERQTIRLALSDWQACGRFDVGDWIYIYDPDAGLVDEANEMSRDGQTIYPRKVRVVERTWRIGDPGSFRVEVRRPDGTCIDISDTVDWDPAGTTAEIVVADPPVLPIDFTSDPDGGPAHQQLARFRQAAV